MQRTLIQKLYFAADTNGARSQIIQHAIVKNGQHLTDRQSALIDHLPAGRIVGV